MIGHHRHGAQVIDRDTEGVVERCGVVHVECHEPIETCHFEQLRHVARVDRIAQLGAKLLAGEGEIRHQRDPAHRPGVLEA